MVNLEGRAQRLRRTVIPPAPDELAWIAKLAERFGVAIDPHARRVAADGARCPMRAARGAEWRRRRRRRRRARRPPTAARCRLAPLPRALLRPGRRARRGAPVPAARRRDRALRRTTPQIRGISTGDEVVVRSNGTSVALRARVNRQLVAGAVRAAEEHVRELDQAVEVSKQ